jgi:hypothetical protein
MNFSYKFDSFLTAHLKRQRLIMVNLLIFTIFLSSCSTKPIKDENIGTQEKFEPNAYERAKNFADKNPVTLFGKDSKDKNTNFDFSTSNVLWRAYLKTLDFNPLATVD